MKTSSKLELNFMQVLVQYLWSKARSGSRWRVQWIDEHISLELNVTTNLPKSGGGIPRLYLEEFGEGTYQLFQKPIQIGIFFKGTMCYEDSLREIRLVHEKP